MGIYFTLFYVFAVGAPIVAGILSTRVGTARTAFDLGALMLGLCFAGYWLFDRLSVRALASTKLQELQTTVASPSQHRSGS